MSRKTARQQIGVALFPFLAVLICTMGALIVLLVLRVRQGRVDATTIAVAQIGGGASGEEKERRERLEDAQWQRELLEKSRAEKSDELTQARARVAHLEEHTQRLEAQARELLERARAIDEGKKLRAEDLTAARAEADRLKKEIEKKKKELDEAKKKTGDGQEWYALIPYDGRSGTRRRPIYVECTEFGVIIQPEGLLLKAEDFNGPLGPGNPLDSALRAIRDHWERNAGDKAAQPYPLLVVRPSGVIAFGAAKAAIRAWDDEWGYELISDDKQLDFGPPDPVLDQALTKTVSVARQRQAAMVAMMPRRFQDDEPLKSFAPEPSIRAAGASRFAGDTGVGLGAGTGPGGAGGSGRGGAGNGAAGSGGIGNSGTGTGNGYGASGGTGLPGGPSNGLVGANGPGGVGGNGVGRGIPGGAIAGVGAGAGAMAGGSSWGNGGSGYGPGGRGGAGGFGGSTPGGLAAGGGTGAGNGGPGSGGSGYVGPDGGAGAGGSGGGGVPSIAAGAGATDASSQRIGFSNSMTAGGIGGSGGDGGGEAFPYSQNGGGGGASGGSGYGQGAGGQSGNGPALNAPGNQSFAGGSSGGGSSSSGTGGGSTGGGQPGGSSGASGSVFGGSSGGSESSAMSGGGGQPGGSPFGGSSTMGGSPGGMGIPSLTFGQKPPAAGSSGGPSSGSPKSTAKRSNNWARPQAKPHETGVTRPLRVSIESDRVVLVPERGDDRPPQIVKIAPNLSLEDVNHVVSAVQNEVKGWGLAVANGYWKPVLQADVAPGAEQHFENLQMALKGSGIDVVRR